MNRKSTPGAVVIALGIAALMLPSVAGCKNGNADTSADTGTEQVAGQIVKDVDEAHKKGRDQLRQTPIATEDDVMAIVDGGNAFALDLFRQLRDRPGNLFFSPFSISSALAMTYAGARGETAREMAAVMHFPPQQKLLHPAYMAFTDRLLLNVEHPPYELSVANRLWGQIGFEFLPEFLQTTRTFYGAELAQVDFAGQTEQTRQQINGWVADRTRQKILDLIPEGILGPASRLVLTNAIYFYGKWARQFKEDATREETFYLSATDSVDVMMMRQRDKFAHASRDGVDILQLPYQGDDLACVVLLPQKRDGLADLETRLDLESLRNWLAALEDKRVQVYLPKFQMTSSFELADVLARMGMPAAFSSAADFSGMTGRPDLSIDAVIHKAFVDVQEEGTEAAAATAVTMKMTSVADPERPVLFRADHPFLLLIRDLRTGGVLFMGRLADPSS